MWATAVLRMYSAFIHVHVRKKEAGLHSLVDHTVHASDERVNVGHVPIPRIFIHALI